MSYNVSTSRLEFLNFPGYIMELYTADITRLFFTGYHTLEAAEQRYQLEQWCRESFGRDNYMFRWFIPVGINQAAIRIIELYSAEHMVLFKLRWNI